MPPGLVRVLNRVETAAERGVRARQRRRRRSAETKRDRRVLAAGFAGQRHGAGLHDVAVGCRGVVPIHRVVAAQIGPAVARAEVAARVLGERRRGHEGAARFRVRRDQRAPHRRARVVVAVARQAGVVHHVQVQRLLRKRLEVHSHQQHRPTRIGRIRLGDTEPSVRVRVDLLVGEAARIGELERVLGAVGFALHPGLPVGDDELQVAHRGRAQVRIVDLGELTAVQRVPHLAGQGGGRCRSRPCYLPSIGLVRPVLLGRHRSQRRRRRPARASAIAPTTPTSRAITAYLMKFAPPTRSANHRRGPATRSTATQPGRVGYAGGAFDRAPRCATTVRARQTLTPARGRGPSVPTVVGSHGRPSKRSRLSS